MCYNSVKSCLRATNRYEKAAAYEENLDDDIYEELTPDQVDSKTRFLVRIPHGMPNTVQNTMIFTDETQGGIAMDLKKV